MKKAEPTKRAVVDLGYKCNINCKFCYYHHLGDLRKQSFKSTEQVMEECNAAIARGNTHIDFTGGEPTLFPALPEIIYYLTNEKNIGTTVITNGLAGVKQTYALIDAGVEDFLVSVHGPDDIHDELTESKARERQIEFLERLDGVGLRFNFVINSFNQNHIVETAKWMADWSPSIVNFINFNPHGEWSCDTKGTREVLADLFVVQKQLEEAIPYLTNDGIGVNLRYYPMCRIDEKYRKCVCNDLHVAFDPYEWDYKIEPKTFPAFFDWSTMTSANMEWKGAPCSGCSHLLCCGGINRAFQLASRGEYTTALGGEKIKDHYHYRKESETV